jgi:flagellar motor switch protein FliM
MADFLSQDEIDCLLDICEDGEIVVAENIGIITLVGTSQEELQTIEIGARGTKVRGFTLFLW